MSALAGVRSLISARGASPAAGIQRASTILLGIHVVGAGLLFAYNVALARLLGREAYGVFVYVENISELLLPLALLGLPQTVVRHVAVYRGDQQWSRLRGLLRVARLGALGAGVVLAAVAWLTYGWLWSGPAGAGGWTLAAGLVLLPLFAVLHIDQAVLQGLRAPIVGMLPNQILRPVAAISVTALLWWLAALDVTTALVVFAGSVLATEIATALAAGRRLRGAGAVWTGAADLAALRQWFAMSWVLLAGSVTRRLLQRANILIIGALGSAAEVGLFAIGFQATRFIGFALASVGIVSGPHAAKHFHERDYAKVQAVFDDAVRWIALIAVPIAAVFVIFGEQILALFGEGYQGGYPAFAALVLGQLVAALTGPTGSMLTMAGDQKWLLASLVAGAIVNVTMSVALVPAHGAFGAALGGLGGLFVANAAMVGILRYKYGLRLRFRRRAARQDFR